jgi:hypothetical protein
MQTVIISLNSINQLMFVMVKCGGLFEVWTESLNIIQLSFSFKGLNGLPQITFAFNNLFLIAKLHSCSITEVSI